MISHKDSIDPGYILDNPFKRNCIYCGNELLLEEIERITSIRYRDFAKYFKDHVKGMKEIHGSFSPNYFKILSGLNYESTYRRRCLVCGWWDIYEEYWAGTEWQIWQVFYGVAGLIKKLDITDISAPISEIRAYLVRKYNDRFNVNPRKFEQTVASVFRDLGYESTCTAYTKDGGIDVILSGNSSIIGVQVKRTKNTIKVEQIRAFLGALLVNKMSKGFYITTSDYQAGCHSIANQYAIELINNLQFYNALKEAQIIKNTKVDDFDTSSIGHLYYSGCLEINSL